MQELIENAFSSIGVGVIIANNNPQLIYSNPFGEKILRKGLPEGGPEDWVGYYGIFYPGTNIPFRPEELPLARALKGETVIDFELFFRNTDFPDGIHVRCTASPILGKDGKIEGGMVVFSDITELVNEKKKLKESVAFAKKALKHKTDFLSHMSHELRTPLNAIIGYSGLMLEEWMDDEQVSIKDLERLNNASNYLLSLINNVLDMAKLEAGKLTYDIHEFEVEELVARVLHISEPLAQKQNNKLTVKTENGLGTIRSDFTRLQQSLINLMSNACKFTEGGEVTLMTELKSDSRGEKIAFSVKDTGCGIDAESAKKIFKPFEQADISSTKIYEGTGLGLSISNSFVKGLGGDIAFESSPAGSTFTITVPRKAAVG